MSEDPLVPRTSREHTVCLLARIGQVTHRLAESELTVPGLRVRHYNIMQIVADHGPIPQLDIGTTLRIDPATMVSSLDVLEQAGLVTRTRSQIDRRRYVIALTPVGQIALDKANAGLDDLDFRMLGDLTINEQATLHRLLAKLAVGPTLADAFDLVRDQTGSRKMSRTSSS